MLLYPIGMCFAASLIHMAAFETGMRNKFCFLTEKEHSGILSTVIMARLLTLKSPQLNAASQRTLTMFVGVVTLC